MDFTSGLITVGRSHARDTTKGNRAEAISINSELVVYLRRAIAASASERVFPAPDGKMLRKQTQLELVLRRAMHPVREARGWVFNPAEVAELKLTRMAPHPAAPAVSEGKIAARVFYLFDHGRELREVVQEAEVPPSVVRELWHEWLTDLEEGEMERRKTAQSERRRRQEQEEMRAVERQSEREQKNFETMMAGLTAAMSGKDKG